MILSLRRKHRLIWLFSALLLPVILFLALGARRPPAQMAALPAEITGPTAVNGNLLFETPWQGEHDIRIRVYAGETPLTPPSLELTPSLPILKPDLLVYWSEMRPEEKQPPPGEAYLLGVLGGTATRSFHLPPKAMTTAGHLLLFSLAHQELIAVTPLPEIKNPPEGTP